MTVPRELTAGDGGVVLQHPAREIERHYASVRVGEGSLEVAGDTCFDVVVDVSTAHLPRSLMAS